MPNRAKRTSNIEHSTPNIDVRAGGGLGCRQSSEGLRAIGHGAAGSPRRLQKARWGHRPPPNSPNFELPYSPNQRSSFKFRSSVLNHPMPRPSASKPCPWPRNPLDLKYHDEEWGVPQHDDRALFELLILEGAQAGLSWSTILAKRENYRRAFDGFDAKKIAKYDARKVAALLADAGIVRNQLKIAATIQNAKAFLEVQREFGSFDRYLWGFVGGKPIVNRRRNREAVPASTPESDAMSRDLLKRGFKFVGTTICYAFMQATGMVNDHLASCPRHAACAKLK